MKKSIALFAAFFTMLGLTLNAQEKTANVNGVIKDGGQKVIESASIMLLNANDSAVVKITLAAKEGKYQFEGISEGKYLVSVSAVGHAKEYSEAFVINSTKSISLKTIELIPVAKSLGVVTVSIKRPLIEQKIDKMIVNVDAAVTNVGTSALEVLEKSPGISIDKDGRISLKGKQDVQIYIDGRPTYLSGTDLTNYLTNLSSSQLDQIEIMTNPPAKYDAAGNSGIINIKTKKTKQVGYSGSISSNWTQGKLARFNESFNFNYRKNKVNLFSTIGYSNRKSFNDISIQRKFIEAGTKELRSHFDQVSRIREGGNSVNAKLGMDFYASKKTTLGLVLTGFKSPGSFRNTSDVLISDPDKILLRRTLASSGNEMKWKNFSTNLNFRHVFDSTGKELTGDIDYLNYNRQNTQELMNAYYDANGNIAGKADTLLGNLPQQINIYTAKVDFARPLKNGSKFEAGAKISLVKTDNNAVYDSLNYGNRVRDIGRSNYFIYEENVNAVYVNYNKNLSKKISGQFGLRVENTNAKGNQVTTGEKFNRKYTQVFPTAFFQYKANEKNSYGLNYGRRINRPNYQDLNPFIMFLDRYTFEQGNPNLQPQFSHNVEVSHTYKGFLTTTINFTRTTDIINDVLEQNSERNETFVKKSNIAKQRQLGIAISGGGQIKKWWSGNLYLNVYNNLFEGVVNGDFVNLSATTGQANISNQFRFGKNWGAELSGYYNTGGVHGVFRIKNFGMMNAGISKQVLKGKGSVKITVRDILYTNNRSGNIKYSNIDASFQQVRDSRQVSVGFNYRFSKGKINGQKRKTGGAGDEQNRVKTGEN